ncbi:MAG TPA: hypothetical protein DCS28_03035 [Candidatus Moranbacteria bacterium]|nr:hypothetical protein [Candidatus Moranbacteria bacterium]HAT74987.1 hypothetical protein [Candidatus Moranbacteria bacterium]
MRKIKKTFKIIFKIFLVIFALVCALFIFFNIPVRKENVDAKLGVTFSMRYAQDIGLDWRAAYVAVMDDLQARKIRLPVYWDLVEPRDGEYDFSDLDWQLEEAEKRNVEIILVVGQKVPRWPECSIPEYLKNDAVKRKEKLLEFVGVITERYKNSPAVKYWQVENEPFLKFGVCPDLDVNLLDQEIATVRKIDPGRKIIITDSGELSLWARAAKRADIFGTTMYRTIHNSKIGFYTYPIGPRFFQFKYWLNKIFTGQNNVIVIELQAEPWIDGWTTNSSLEDQFVSMNAEKLKDNLSFARQAGFPEIYFWGAEWWYWLKVRQNHPELWDTAKELFRDRTNNPIAEFPKVKNVFPANGKKEVIIGAEDPIIVDFNKSTRGYFIKFVLDPESEVVYQNNSEKTQFKLLPKDKIRDGTVYKLKILAKIFGDDDANYREIYNGSFETLRAAPLTWEADFQLRLDQAKKYTRAKKIIGKYVDINLQTQIMSIFEEGKLLDTFLISSGKRGMGTPVGEHRIYNKFPRAFSKAYGLFMPYWMAILPDGKMGIHELPEWPGGYKEGVNHLGVPVSHGCVRLGVGPAKTVYDWADIGTPVVVY